MTLNDLFQWWNLIFVLPLSAGLLQTVLQGLGGFHGSHHHIHVGHHGAGEHHIHFHIGHHGTHPTGRVPGHHQETAHHDTHFQPGLLSRLLGILGVGRVPLMTIISTFCLLWGFVGVVSNQILSGLPPAIFIWPSLAIATTASTLTTGLMARVLGRLMPNTETYVESEQDMVGRSGQAHTMIDGRLGSIALLDQFRNRIELKVFTEDGEIIPRGSEVMIMRYDEDRQKFVVQRRMEASVVQPKQLGQ